MLFYLEPKFEIPSGDPYTGGWCRPQTDGPALRAMALSKWGMILIDAGQSSTAKSDVWPLVKFDMEWVLGIYNIYNVLLIVDKTISFQI